MSSYSVSVTEVSTSVMESAMESIIGSGVSFGNAAIAATRQILASRGVAAGPRVTVVGIMDRLRSDARSQLGTLQPGLSLLKEGVRTRPETRRAVDSLARAQALRSALERQPALQIAIQPDRPAMQTVAGDLSRIETALREGRVADAGRLAQKSERILIDIVSGASRRLQDAGRLLVATGVEIAVTRMGYADVQIAERNGATAVWARDGAHGIAVVVPANGNLIVDTVGFEGSECEADTQRLFTLLEEMGIGCHREKGILHRRPEGGSLVETARQEARQTKCSAADALLSVYDRTAPPDAAPHSSSRAAAWIWSRNALKGGS